MDPACNDCNYCVPLRPYGKGILVSNGYDNPYQNPGMYLPPQPRLPPPRCDSAFARKEFMQRLWSEGDTAEGLIFYQVPDPSMIARPVWGCDWGDDDRPSLTSGAGSLTFGRRP